MPEAPRDKPVANRAFRFAEMEPSDHSVVLMIFETGPASKASMARDEGERGMTVALLPWAPGSLLWIRETGGFGAVTIGP